MTPRRRPRSLPAAALLLLSCAVAAAAAGDPWRIGQPRSYRKAMVGIANSTQGKPARARRLQTSMECTAALMEMMADPLYLYVDDAWGRFCRVKMENEFANCCKYANFAMFSAEGCSDCLADCIHQPMIDLCKKDYGVACVLTRKPFWVTPGAENFKSKETACIPSDCDNKKDKRAILEFMETASWFIPPWQAGWRLDYGDSSLECPSNLVIIIVCVLLGFFFLLAMIPVGLFLFQAPKERGRTLISQADMQGSAQIEPFYQGEDALRQTGMGGDTFASSASFPTR